MIKFSVLMSTYFRDKADYLDECLASLYKQTLQANEIVIVKDGCIPDSLTQVITKWSSLLPIKTVELDSNTGLGNALNMGLNACSYNLIARMDTDDICLPDRFRQQVDFFLFNSNAGVLGSAIEEFDEDMLFSQGIRFSVETPDEIFEFSKKRNPLNHMSVMFRKDIILKVGGYQHHLYMEDYNLWLRCLSDGVMVYNLPNVLINVRAGISMIARRKGMEYIKSEIKLAMLLRKLNITSIWGGYSTLCLRIGARILPTRWLSKLYKKIRNQSIS